MYTLNFNMLAPVDDRHVVLVQVPLRRMP